MHMASNIAISSQYVQKMPPARAAGAGTKHPKAMVQSLRAAPLPCPAASPISVASSTTHGMLIEPLHLRARRQLQALRWRIVGVRRLFTWLDDSLTLERWASISLALYDAGM